MFDKLATEEQRYEELMRLLGTSGCRATTTEFRKHAKALAEIEPLVEQFREYKAVVDDIAADRRADEGGDPDMRELAQEELKSLDARRDALLAELKILLVPKDPNDEKNVVLEIRAGTGGDEAALFAADLFRMYTRYAERQGWQIEVMSSSDTGVGGIKEVIAIDRRPRRLQQAEIRERRPPRAARAGHRSERPHPHLDRDRRGAAGSRGSRHPDRRQGPAHRHVLLERPGRPERQHHLLRGPHHPHPDRHRRLAAGREVADQEPREGDEGAALAALRDGAAEAAGRDRQGPPQPGRHRRALGEDPHLQLPARTASPTTASTSRRTSSPTSSTATSTS